MASKTIEHRPVIVLIRDGWGENPYSEWDHANAIKLARPAFEAKLRAEWPFALVRTSGLDVGLPEGTMGNSEVGHQNIGAGRIADQDAVRITKEIENERFFSNAELVAAVETCLARKSKLHLMGLASDIGVHSRLAHLSACVELAARRGLKDVFVHCFMDGRDSPPNSGIDYVKQIEDDLFRITVGRIASVCGRYWAMDRDNRWDRTEKAYRMLAFGEGAAAPNARAAVHRYYDNPLESNMRGDEFILPTVISDDGQTPVAMIEDGDAVIYFNFRGDRPRQLIKSFMFEEFPFHGTSKAGEDCLMGFDRGGKRDLFFVGMTEYEAGLPVKTAFPKPPKMENIAGQYLSDLGLRQFRCAETEKYAHVTFFFNDYREEPFPGEERQLVGSPQVATYDLQPEMSAHAVTEIMLKRIAEGVDDFIVLNYANPDMIGHTGVIDAAVKACRTVDECVGKVVSAVLERGGCGVVTADHGNLEQMIDPKTGGPHTAHTTYPVPLYVVGEAFKGIKLREGGRLADIMPTILTMMELPVPEEMTGTSLIL